MTDRYEKDLTAQLTREERMMKSRGAGRNVPLLRLIAVFGAFALVVAACGDDDATTTTAASATTAAASGAVSLAGVCPDPMVIQLDWEPESEHGGLY